MDVASDRWSSAASAHSSCEDDSGDSDDNWGTAESGTASDDPVSNSNALVHFLLNLVFAGQMSARTMCVICWFACRGGCKGHDIARYAFSPDAQSGKYQAHLDRCLGINTKNAAYMIDVPLLRRGALVRRRVPTAVQIPHVDLLDEAEGTTTLQDTLDVAIQQNKLPPSYFEHE
eukprot:7243157-Pyramimonas_sp.AAC.1